MACSGRGVIVRAWVGKDLDRPPVLVVSEHALDRRTAALLEETLTEYGVGGLAGALEEDAEGCAHLVGESEEEYGERSGASA